MEVRRCVDISLIDSCNFQDTNEIVLRWPHTDAKEVIVSGDFDQVCILQLIRRLHGF